MARLVPAEYRILEKFVKSVGCKFERQTSSHLVYWRDGLLRPIIIPKYKLVPKFIIRNILRQLNISVEDYCRLIGSK